MIKTVQKIDLKDGRSERGPWTRYDYTFTDSVKANTFELDIYAAAPEGATRDFELEKNDRGYLVIKSVKEAPPEAIADAPTEKPDWEAKDRRIAMESAYASAARFYQHRTTAQLTDLARLARAIYRDIQVAGRDEEFPTLKND